MISLGGATEATVWSNWYPVETVDPRWPSIPYGRPISDRAVPLSMPGCVLCPVGVAGDPLSAATVSPLRPYRPAGADRGGVASDPFAVEPGARLYARGTGCVSSRTATWSFWGGATSR